MQIRNKINVRATIILAGVVLECWALYVVGASPEHWRPSMIVKDEPTARALYDVMIETIREAESLSYNSICSGPDGRASVYSIWLKKSNYFRVEAANPPSLKCSTLVGDGDSLWIYWQGIRPFLNFDDAESHAKTRSDVYIKKATPAGRNSIGHEIALLGITWYGTILEPSIFHGYKDTLEPYIDGIRSRGPDDVGDDECDVIEVSYMDAQLTRYFWVSKQDNMPRQIKEIDRLSSNIVRVEEWSDVKLNSVIPQQTFAWSAPEGWRQWNAPGPADVLLKNGQEAPDFNLLSADGSRIKLSDYRGKIVWLFMWRTGSPSCREAMPNLQKLHDKYESRGLVIIGFNYADNKRITQSYMRENSVTFPNVLDSASDAEKVMLRSYKNKTQTVPLNYIIDSQGNVVDAWFGYEEGSKRTSAALKKAGLQLED
jgi:peroxiredoxin/outer membrane lipoprotein-sorting protein